ncbi:unnamed protein product [Euphydryas editha]|uniref:Uncharacterized protein n=1 Tax=Euphydryas editha TaxID=104508 RepID=A0AAU9TF62_EUPED|nr:unnamed protein product [Euphydryas editha]
MGLLIVGIIATLIQYTIQAAINDKQTIEEYPNEVIYVPIIDDEFSNEMFYDINSDPIVRSGYRIKQLNKVNENRNIKVLAISIQTTLTAYIVRNEDDSYYDDYDVLRHKSDDNDDDSNQIAPRSENIQRDKIQAYISTLTADQIARITNIMKKKNQKTKLNHNVGMLNSSQRNEKMLNSLMSALKDFVDLLDEKKYKEKYSSQNSYV